MKFTIDQKRFHEALKALARIAPSRPSHPEIANIVLTVLDDSVVLCATDLSVWLKLRLDAVVEKPGTVAVPASMFATIVSKQKGTVEVSVSKKQVVIKGSSTSKIQAMSTGEFPEIEHVDGESFTVSASSLRSHLEAVSYAASTDDTKHLLTGVYVGHSDDGIGCVATDGHRMAWSDLSVDSTNSIVVPGFAVQELTRSVSDSDVLITSNHSGVQFSWDSGTLISRLLDGQYPRFRQLIPTSFKHTIVCDRVSLLDCLNRAVFAEQDKSNLVLLKVTPGSVEVCSNCADLGDSSESISAESNVSIHLAFSMKYLKDAIAHAQGDELTLQINSPTQSVIIKGSGKAASLVMPLQIRN